MRIQNCVFDDSLVSLKVRFGRSTDRCRARNGVIRFVVNVPLHTVEAAEELCLFELGDSRNETTQLKTGSG